MSRIAALFSPFGMGKAGPSERKAAYLVGGVSCELMVRAVTSVRVLMLPIESAAVLEPAWSWAELTRGRLI